MHLRENRIEGFAYPVVLRNHSCQGAAIISYPRNTFIVGDGAAAGRGCALLDRCICSLRQSILRAAQFHEVCALLGKHFGGSGVLSRFQRNYRQVQRRCLSTSAAATNDVFDGAFQHQKAVGSLLLIACASNTDGNTQHKHSIESSIGGRECSSLVTACAAQRRIAHAIQPQINEIGGRLCIHNGTVNACLCVPWCLQITFKKSCVGILSN